MVRHLMPLRPVERVCKCPTPVGVPGNANHTAECNKRHAAAFFASVAMAREDLARRLH